MEYRNSKMKRKEKSLEERTNEMIQLYQQLQNLGIHRQFEEMEVFYTAANEFVKNKISCSGVIRLPMLQRDVHYQLITFHPKPSNVFLKYVGS